MCVWPGLPLRREEALATAGLTGDRFAGPAAAFEPFGANPAAGSFLYEVWKVPSFRRVRRRSCVSAAIIRHALGVGSSLPTCAPSPPGRSIPR